MAKKEEENIEVSDSRKEQLLNEALKTIEKQYGKGSVMKLGDGVQAGVEVIPTGALLSNTVMNQKETIPSIAHAYSLEVNE